MSTVDEPTTLVIRNGTVIDGTGAPGHRADVLIADGKIVEIGKLTGQQADLFGFDDRGYLQPGMWADITVFDPATVDPGPVRRVRDFPADAERLTADAERLTAETANPDRRHSHRRCDRGQARPACTPSRPQPVAVS